MRPLNHCVVLLIVSFGIISICGIHVHAQAGPDREEFRDLLRANFDKLVDFEFRYEGVKKTLKTFDDSSSLSSKRLSPQLRALYDSSVSYQGTFAYRSDSAAHSDLFTRVQLEPTSTTEEIRCLLRGEFSKRRVIADRGEGAGHDEKQTSHMSAMLDDYSPMWFVGLPLLLMYSGEPTMDYRFVGWESIRNHKCLVVEFQIIDKATSVVLWGCRYWLDVERGAHALKIEQYIRSKLITRADEIELARFESQDGAAFWFPTRGKVWGFVSGLAPPSAKPFYEKTFDIIKGYPRLNQKLPDARFTLDWGQKVEGRKLAVAASAPVRPKPIPIEDQLAEGLRKADQVSPSLEASSPTRSSWFSRNWISVVLGATGVAALTTAIRSKR